ncbi:hypothetical protein AB4343_01270 [Vibrio breoganii]|uniref:Lipoprotein n=1 Tax=Vibrio breoganii TaxID=553239 RepID=A0ABX1U2K9_9VIBR|nr:hypothetical protein [Vibrio breoganii]NMO74768.1 hypothetical protein [Vibrio breoganii]NMR68694.1 hypothetical protein [Vibrio breoganii]PMG05538.1 hypothetical protein BCV08_05640 [Vibrio breoganii]PMG35940.1 hypothetical protein BCU93_17005 [Vibrio breoganii]PMG92437.1 hypothetical protein BCU80_10715 [Vibrio breoganii]
MRKTALAVITIAGVTLLSGCNPESELKNIEHKAEKEILRNTDGISAAEVALTFRAPFVSHPVNLCYVRTGDHELAASVSKSDVSYVETSHPISKQEANTCGDLGLDSTVRNVQVDFNEDNTQVNQLRRGFKNFEVQQDFTRPLALSDFGLITLRSPDKDMSGYDYQVTIALESKDSEKVVLKSGFVKHNASENDWVTSPHTTTYKDVRDIKAHGGIPSSVKSHRTMNIIWNDNLLNL